MGHRINLVGQKFNKLTVLEFSHVGPNYTQMWKCLCDCGTFKIVSGTHMKRGTTKSCGCVAMSNIKTHGESRTPLYVRWYKMKSRCDNKKLKEYKNYGGRGIRYCAKWSQYEGFKEDMGETFNSGLELDRIDVDGNYCKENCRWTTSYENAFNRRISQFNTSNKTGVSFSKIEGKWRAYIGYHMQHFRLGSFANYKDAVEARVLAELDFYGYVKP